MRGRRSRLAFELFTLALVAGGLVAALAVIVRVYRHDATRSRSSPLVSDRENDPTPALSEHQALALRPPPAKCPADGTAGLVRPMEAESKSLREQLARLERRSKALETAREGFEQETKDARDREQARARGASEQATRLRTVERELSTIRAERERATGAVKALRSEREHAEIRARGSYSILPYKVANGTWRRPIAIECRDGRATVQPNGPSFSLLELSGARGALSSPIARAIVSIVSRTRDVPTPDGAASVPYLLFLVRPDGIRPYYEARARLEPLGVAFGYELIDQDLQLEFPDLDQPSEWTEIPGPFARERVKAEEDPANRPFPISPPGVIEGGGVLGAGRAAGDEHGPRSGHNLPGLDLGEARALSNQGPYGGRELPRALPDWVHVESSEHGGLLKESPSRATAGVEASGGRVENLTPEARGPNRRPDERVELFPHRPGDTRSISGEPQYASGPGRRRADVQEAPERSREPANTAAASRDSGSTGVREGLAGEPAPTAGGLSHSGGTSQSSNSAPSPLAEGLSEAAEPTSAGPGSIFGEGGGSGGRGGSRSLEFIILCNREGLVIRPGMARRTIGELGQDARWLPEQLRALYRAAWKEAPEVGLRPRIRILVEPGGEAAARHARGQLALAGVEWPTKVQFAEAGSYDWFLKERR